MGVEVHRIVNSLFNSNTYILSNVSERGVWIIDPGDFSQIETWLKINNEEIIKGILLTHTHFDHCYGINELLNNYSVQVSVFYKYSFDALGDSKLNGSRYAEIPFTVNSDKIKLADRTKEIELWDNSILSLIETPGHTVDSMSFLIDKELFTGDALIPGVKVVTKLKGGDKLLALQSIHTLLKNKGCYIYPGHRDIVSIEEINSLDLY